MAGSELRSTRGQRTQILAWALASALVLASAGPPPGLRPGQVQAAPSASGWKWVGGNEESQFMRPGLDCVSCHARGEGPRFSVAGTVYTRLDERDDWLGYAGATVQVTDATGRVHRLETNAAGNFMLRGGLSSLVFPLKAKVIAGGKENAMYSPLQTGNCMSCHTANGANGAPGRVVVP